MAKAGPKNHHWVSILSEISKDKNLPGINLLFQKRPLMVIDDTFI